jgi:CheY-like chemotaxis protein
MERRNFQPIPNLKPSRNRKPIIISSGMSANSDSYSKDCALQAGMNVFLGKPFTIGELQQVLDSFDPRKRF